MSEKESKTTAEQQMKILTSKGIYVYRGEVRRLYGNMFLKVDNLLYKNHGKDYYSNHITENLPVGDYVRNIDQSWTFPFKIQPKNEGDSWISFNNCQINVTQGKVYLHEPDVDVEIAIEPDIHFDFDFKLSEQNKELLDLPWLDELSHEDRNGKWLELLNNYKLGAVERFFMNPLLLKYCIPVAMFGSADRDMGKSTYIDMVKRTFGALPIHFLNDGFWDPDIENLNHSLICCGNEVPTNVLNKGSSIKEIFDPDRNVGGVVNIKGSSVSILDNHGTLVLFSNDPYPFKGESFFKRMLSIGLHKMLRGATPEFNSLTEKDFQNWAIYCVNGVLTVKNSESEWDDLWMTYEASVDETRKHIANNISWVDYFPIWLEKCIFDIDELDETNQFTYNETLWESLRDYDDMDKLEFRLIMSDAYDTCLADFMEFITYEYIPKPQHKTNFNTSFKELYPDKLRDPVEGHKKLRKYRFLPKKLRKDVI